MLLKIFSWLEVSKHKKLIEPLKIPLVNYKDKHKWLGNAWNKKQHRLKIPLQVIE